MTILEVGRQILRGERETFPVARLLGMVLKELEPGRAVFELAADERHHNPLGTLHGGIYCDLADAAMGYAYAATLGENESFTTVELKINFLRGEAPPPPIARLLGFVLKSVEPGRAVFEMMTDERHHNPLGTLHGGIYCDLADAAMGFAYAATLAEGETFTTIELKINFLRAVRQATLTAEARVVKAGRTLGYVECDVKDQAGRLIARAASTCMRLKLESQSGTSTVGTKEN